MKKLLGISLIAVLAATPLMAGAAAGDPTPIANTPATTFTASTSGLASNGTNVVTSEKGGYFAGKVINVEDQQAAASAAYVKGAYNDAISAVNAVHAEAKGTADTIAGYGDIVTHDANEFATAAQGALAASALQKSDITEGATNGTIAVEGTDVAVHGLGSAAYTASTDYATAAQGTKADNAANKDLSNLSATGKANVAAQGTYSAQTNYTAGTVGAAIKGKADSATTLSGYGITDAYTKTEVDTALGGKADSATTLAGYGITDAYTKTEADTSFATKTGVVATVEAATASKTGASLSVSGNVTGAIPVMVNWGDTTANTTNVALANGAIANGATATGDITGIDVSVTGYTAGTGNGN